MKTVFATLLTLIALAGGRAYAEPTLSPVRHIPALFTLKSGQSFHGYLHAFDGDTVYIRVGDSFRTISAFEIVSAKRTDQTATATRPATGSTVPQPSRTTDANEKAIKLVAAAITYAGLKALQKVGDHMQYELNGQGARDRQNIRADQEAGRDGTKWYVMGYYVGAKRTQTVVTSEPWKLKGYTHLKMFTTKAEADAYKHRLD